MKLMLKKSIALYLSFVPHGSLPKNRDLSTRLLLQPLDGVPLRSKDLPHKVKLRKATGEIKY